MREGDSRWVMSDASGQTKRPRVLIVDDDPVTRHLAGEALFAAGFEAEEAEDGERALLAADASYPDLVLLDVEMPGLNGFETCTELRRRSAGSEVPILIVTSSTDAETIERAFEAGATDFVSKPVDWQLLQHRVRFVMRASDAFSEVQDTLSELRVSQERLAKAQRLAHIGSWEWLPGSVEMLWSEEVYRILGIELRAGASTYEAFMRVIHPDDRPVVDKAMRDLIHEAQPLHLDHRIVLPGGAQRVIHQQAELVGGPGGAAELVSGTIQDITDRARAAEQIRLLAYYDSLTGLPNRKMLTQTLNRALESARRRESTIALLFLGLDRFKRINDTLGLMVGDELLKAVAARMMSCVRQTDSVGRAHPEDDAAVSRLGGDEFTVVLNDLGSSEQASYVARRILEALRSPLSLNGQELVMSASIGIAVYPTDGADAEALLRKADTALHHAKVAGGGVYQFFSESMNERATRNLRLESGLRAALKRDELKLHYQPLLDVRTDAFTGVEALARWTSEECGPVPPNEFIPLAEETGLIETLGEWALRTACAQGRGWDQAGLDPLRVSVNISSQQVRKPGTVEIVERVLRESHLDPSRLELEITESVLIGDEPGVSETLDGLKRLGIRLALDDFGTGYSSLSYLVRFPIDTIKIDRSFVSRIGTDEQAQAIVAAVVAMAHRMNLSVTAEGVETPEQEAFLRAEGCDVLQGYLFSRPIEPDALFTLLQPSEAL
jgi:diguanylate cyclase (GGDEF)-like protein